MNRLKKQGFTLVELVVVVTILAILGTIAFITLEWYSADARDSTRLSDISSLKTSLELFNLDAWKYPKPTNYVNITYSWAIVWNQWTFWETVFTNVTRLDKIPLDPITNKEYTYSILNNWFEYQLWWIVEGDTISLNNEQWIMNNVASSPLIRGELRGVSAWNIEATAYITWNYNWQMTKSNSWATCSVLALPSIMVNDTSSWTDLQDISANNRFVYRWFKNLPSSFKSSKFKYNWWFAFAPNNLVAYTDTGSCTQLTSTTWSWTEARVSLIKWLQNSYSWTILKDEWDIWNITSLNIDTNNPSPEVVAFAGNFVNNVLWSSIIANTVTSWPEYTVNPNVTWGWYFDIIQDINFANVWALLRMNETTLKDEVWNAVTLYWNTSRSSTQSKYGWYSAYFDWAWDSLTIWSAWSVTWVWDFTVEYWMNPTAFWSSYRCQLTNDTSGWFATCVNSNWTISFGRSLVATDWVTSNSVNFWQWNHVAISRSSGSLKIFVNWLQWYSWSISTSYAAWNIRVWTDWGWSSFPYQWYIDDLRITKWVARYTSNFTSPTQEFTKENYRMSWVSADASTTAATSCKYYNLNSTTLNDWTARWSGTCGNGSQACLSNGTYLIDPDWAWWNNAFEIYCDMNTDWWGWSLITNVFWNVLKEDVLWLNLSQTFVFPFSQTNSIKSLSTQVRYTCKRSTSIIDVKTTNATLLNRPTYIWDWCSEWYNWNSGVSYTNLPSNNFNYSVWSSWVSCCCRESHKLNTYPVWLHYSHWFITDRYYYNWSNMDPWCAWGGWAEYMRVFYK